MDGKGRYMIKKEKRTDKSGTGRKDSAYGRAAGRRKCLLLASLFLAVLVTAAGLCCMQTYADTSDNKTKTVVIRTDSDDKFAAETAKLAKKSRGLTIQSTGAAKAYSSGRLIVCVKNGSRVDFSKYNAATVVESNFGISLVQFNSGSEAKKAAKKIAALSSVSYVEPDDCAVNLGDTKVEHIYLEGSSMQQGEDDGLSGDESGAVMPASSGMAEDQAYQQTLQASGVTVSSNAMSWGASYIQADKYAAFVKANTKKSITVAVVDSGVSYHVKMKGRILPGKDFVDNDSNPSDKNGHGTHVAGTIVDCTPGINVKILPVRVINASGSGSPSVVGNGIRYAVNKGAKVINLSLSAFRHYNYIEQCITYAFNKGVTVVVAAGNESQNTQYVCPAHMDTPIVVGAINSSGKRASFSNYGSSLDITAPGVDITSCWLNGQYATATGTSMAAPHISAAAAMYRLMNPWIKGVKTQYFVRCYAKDLGAKGTDKYYGRGVPRMAGSITPSKVTLSKTNLSLQVKKTATLKAAITPYYAGKNKLTWTSSNKNVVTVSGGKITAKGRGTATVTVKTVNGKKASCKVTVTSASSASSAGTIKGLTKKVTAASDQADTSSENQTDRAPGSGTPQSPAAEDTLTAAAAQETVRIYIYPSEKAGNTPVQDGSIVEGSRLALEAEIVPAQTGTAALRWKSSCPEIAEIDENGLVTALSAGETQITARLSSAEENESAGTDATDAAEASDLGLGTFTIKVVKPSILTRWASYGGGNDSEVKMDAVVRLPSAIRENSQDSEDDADRINPQADYVLALLGRKGEGCTLLGAVNLGGDDNGTVHSHNKENGKARTDIKEPKDVSDPMLGDLSSGKQDTEAGILYLNSVKSDGCKADMSLKANLDALRVLARAGSSSGERVTDCVLAVYTDSAFEEREEAVKEKDKEKILHIDQEAVCSCSFHLSYDLPDAPGKAAEEAAPSDSTDNSTVDETQPRTGSDTDRDSTGTPEDKVDPSGEKAEEKADTEEDSGSSSSEENTQAEPASDEEAADAADDKAEAEDGREDREKSDVTPDENTGAAEDKASVSAEADSAKDSGSAERNSEDCLLKKTSSEGEASDHAGQTEDTDMSKNSPAAD